MAGTTLGLKKEVVAALSYVLGPLTGLVFLILERDTFVRFHAMQSILGLGILMGIGIFLGFIPFIGLVWILYFILLLMGAYKASQGVLWEMPFVGKISRKFIS